MRGGGGGGAERRRGKERMGVKIKIEKDKIESFGSKSFSKIIDASDCPDIVPILTVLASLSEGVTKIIDHWAAFRSC